MKIKKSIILKILSLSLISTAFAPTIANAYNQETVTVVGGRNRTETSMLASEYQKSHTLVLANSKSFADSLSAFNIISKFDGKLILVDENTDLSDFLSKNNVSMVYLIGGEDILYGKAVNQVSKVAQNVKRLSGSDRYETNMKTLDYADFNSVGVADGRNFPDALSSTTLLNKYKLGLMLVDGSKNYSTYRNVHYTFGDKSSVKQDGGIRIAGRDRYETNKEVLKRLNIIDTYLLSSGSDFADALSSINMINQKNSAIVLFDKFKHLNDIEKTKKDTYVIGRKNLHLFSNYINSKAYNNKEIEKNKKTIINPEIKKVDVLIVYTFEGRAIKEESFKVEQDYNLEKLLRKEVELNGQKYKVTNNILKNNNNYNVALEKVEIKDNTSPIISEPPVVSEDNDTPSTHEIKKHIIKDSDITTKRVYIGEPVLNIEKNINNLPEGTKIEILPFEQNNNFYNIKVKVIFENGKYTQEVSIPVIVDSFKEIKVNFIDNKSKEVIKTETINQRLNTELNVSDRFVKNSKLYVLLENPTIKYTDKEIDVAVEVNYIENTLIQSHEKTTTVEQMKKWALKNNAPQFAELAQVCYDVATKMGVDPALLYAQSAKETGWLYKNGSQAGLDASYHNPAGLKVSTGGSDFDKNAHMRFESWSDGYTAMCEHLLLYAGADGYPLTNPKDPRHFPYLFGKAKTVVELGAKGSYNSNPEYGKDIMRLYNQLIVTE